MSYQTNLFINNEYVPSKANKTFPIFNPVDNSHVADVQEAGAEDVDAAVDAAQAAFYGAWGKMKREDRARIIFKFADLVEARVVELSKLHTVCMGVPVPIGQVFSSFLPKMLRYCGGMCDKIGGETYPPEGDGAVKMVLYEPFGVCAGVAAWNGGFLYEGFKIAPAIAAGNTVVYKSSEKTPLASLALGELVKEAGFPPGVINFVSGAGTTGSLLASHMKIRRLAFTGTSSTGRQVQIAAAKSNLKVVTLELSGKSPAIIFDDAEFPEAAQNCAKEFVLNSGQVCAATSRILVQESIADKFIEEIQKIFEAMGGSPLGDPTAKGTFLGPLADTKHFDIVMNYINNAKSEGVKILAGGARKGDKGSYVLPTLFLDPALNSKIWTDDMFGPVAMIKTFKDEAEAIQMANDTEYGLSSKIYTSSYPRAFRVAKKLEVGAVGVNGGAPPFHETAFGGWKESGYGREGGQEGLRSYLQAKTIWLNGVKL